jgi:hypothetical protein
MSAKDIEDDFPHLRLTGYTIRSPIDPSYNCIAWAVGENWRHWSPLALVLGGYYWPPGAPRGHEVDDIVELFRMVGGYSPSVSNDDTLEPGFEKIAIYAYPDQLVQHVARQTPSGLWVSKLDNDEDIEHRTLDGLEGSIYGTVVRILTKPIPQQA